MVSKILTCIGAVLISAVLLLAILANSMTKPLGHDEQMYCTAGALVAQGKMIYRDFSYLHMLYHPLIYATLFKVLHTSYFLLVGRMVSVVCDIFEVICIVVIYWHVFKPFTIMGLFLGLGASILWVFNPLVDYANGFAWNHDVVILCVVLSLWLLLSTDFQLESRCWRVALVGGLLTFASCMRITTAIVQLVFVVFLLGVLAKSKKEKLRTALLLLVSCAAVLTWPIWVIVSAPRAFFLDLLWIPALSDEWPHKVGMLYDKVGLTIESLTTAGYLVIIIIGVCLCMSSVFCRKGLRQVDVKGVLLSFLVAITMFVIAYIPSTTWRQYLAMPVAFIVVGFAYHLMWFRKFNYIKYFKINIIIFIVGTVISVISHTVVLQRIPRLFDLKNWTALRVHRISEDIAANVREPKLVLTLAPLYAIEGGCRCYTELSAGPFVYRVADYMSACDLDITHTAGPVTLKKLVEKLPPSAVVMGTEPGFLEETLFRAAVKADWKRKTYDNGIAVYFKP